MRRLCQYLRDMLRLLLALPWRAKPEQFDQACLGHAGKTVRTVDAAVALATSRSRVISARPKRRAPLAGRRSPA